jgi:membrane-associated phospholipid phosphatase
MLAGASLLLLILSLLWGDIRLFFELRELKPPYTLSHSLTLLGGGLLAVFTLLWLSRRSLFTWLAFASGWITVGLVTWSGKHLLCPSHLRPAAVLQIDPMPADYPLRYGPGMPSGHSAEAALAALALAAAYPRRRFLQLSLALLVLLIALSRIWMAQHFPSQVGAGLLVGLFAFHLWDGLLFAYRWKRQNRWDVTL